MQSTLIFMKTLHLIHNSLTLLWRCGSTFWVEGKISGIFFSLTFSLCLWAVLSANIAVLLLLFVIIKCSLTNFSQLLLFICRVRLCTMLSEAWSGKWKYFLNTGKCPSLLIIFLLIFCESALMNSKHIEILLQRYSKSSTHGKLSFGTTNEMNWLIRKHFYLPNASRSPMKLSIAFLF